MTELLPFPDQPADVPWPTEAWPTVEPRAVDGLDADRLAALVDEALQDPEPTVMGHTDALLVVHRGRLVVEAYGQWLVRELEALAGKQPGPVLPTDRLLSWSMAKSVTHALVGIAIGDGAFAVTDAPPVPAWSTPDDPRAAITWDDLLAMRPGLQWTEEYYDFGSGGLPDVITMLYGAEAADMASFAASFPLVHEPGSPEAYTYSSGTTNIVAAALQRACGLDEDGMRAFLADRLFTPIGVADPDPRFDEAGTFVGSSYLYLTAQDWARFGLLALRGGVWDGTRVLPEGWMDHGRTPRSLDDVADHGAHWWAWRDERGIFGPRGFEGQRVVCVPSSDTIVVRLGQTHSDQQPALDAHLLAIADLFDHLP